MNPEAHTTLQTLRHQLDEYVIGHEGVKEALMLALIGQEHLYMEGEPGCAKTLLAEVIGNTADLRFHFSQMHRDTRLAELIGDVMLHRSATEDGEVISQKLRHGGVLTAELALLDDISRAPGEALNVLLRILNERKYLDTKIPLLCAIATSNPTHSDYYNEPLDPANLDRFVLQLRTSGAVSGSSWEEARAILNRYDGAHPEFHEQKVDGRTLVAMRDLLREIALPKVVLDAYQKFLDNLRNRYGCTPQNSLLTDRTMLVKVPRMIRALALLEGRDAAKVEDLRVLKHILTFRVPEHVYDQIDEMLEELIEEAQEEQEQQEPPEGQEMEGARGQEEAGESGEDGDEQEGSGEQEMIDQMMEAIQAQGEDAEKRKSMQQQASSQNEGPPSQQHNPPQPVENMEFLMEKIRGRLEKNQAESEVHPGGSPRTFKRMKTFEEFMDADPAETSIWMDSVHPNLPRAFHRKKKHMGGKVVIVRDVSQSMEGRYARWTSSVVTKLVELVRRKRMRIGYIEFNHVSLKYDHDGRFSTRDYDAIISKAANVSCSGVTNYQYPLRDALQEFKRGNTRNKHILFLTDGEPTQGDWLVREERKQAKALGVSVHTVFIGTTECPEILDILSYETDGSQFLATPDDKGGLYIAERENRYADTAIESRNVFSSRRV